MEVLAKITETTQYTVHTCIQKKRSFHQNYLSVAAPEHEFAHFMQTRGLYAMSVRGSI